MLLMSVAPLVALGRLRTSIWRFPDARHASRAYPPRLLVAMLFEHLSAPLPISDLRVPAIYARGGRAG